MFTFSRIRLWIFASFLVLIENTFAVDFQKKVLKLGKYDGFISEQSQPQSKKCWVWYTPTLDTLPDTADIWLLNAISNNNIAIAGVNVGETYGSRLGKKGFELLHANMVRKGYSEKPIFLARSRGGLQALSWANWHPNKIKAIAGIYPLFRLDDYGAGSNDLAKPWEVTVPYLISNAKKLSPIFNLDRNHVDKVHTFIVHGNKDVAVNYEKNALAMKDFYSDYPENFTLVTIANGNHEIKPEFHQNKELLNFILNECSEIVKTNKPASMK